MDVVAVGEVLVHGFGYVGDARAAVQRGFCFFWVVEEGVSGSVRGVGNGNVEGWNGRARSGEGWRLVCIGLGGERNEVE